MLTQLSSVKARLAIPDIDPQYDTILTNTIKAVSARFDRECHRTFARTVDATEEFPIQAMEIAPACYPIEAVTKFETRSPGWVEWVEQSAPAYVIRHGCVISLASPVCSQASTLGSAPALGRVTYTGGYVLPGTAPAEGQTPLPDDLEQAVVEQVAYWFQNRANLGLLTLWPKGGTFQRFADPDLLPGVGAVLAVYARWQY